MRSTIGGGSIPLGSVRNVLHSAVLILAMVALLGAMGALFGGPFMMMVMLGVGVVLLGLGPSFGSHALLRLQGAVPLSPFQAPRLLDMTRRLARRAGLSTVPRLYLIPTSAVTAFTTGARDSAAIAVTDGLLRTLSDRELAGVLAHEVSHIKRNDVWLMGLAHFINRSTHFMSMVGQFLLLLNLPLMLVGRFTLPWSAILLLMFAPAISGLLQLALSRTREYEADVGAARLTGDPLGLASALAKLERMNETLWDRFMTRHRGERAPSLLQTHPATRDRIERLMQLGRSGGETTARAVA